MTVAVETVRCFGNQPGIMRDYHDSEWGVPLREETRLFELLILEGCQAGLSWEQVLKRRENYRRAFHRFNMEKVAALNAVDVGALMTDPGIIRNRRKIEAAIKNARAALKLQGKGGLSGFLWSFVEGKPLQPRLTGERPWPAKTALSEKISKELGRLGFSFVGPVIVYALMQSAGLVNDHKVECFRHREVEALGGSVG